MGCGLQQAKAAPEDPPITYEDSDDTEAMDREKLYQQAELRHSSMGQIRKEPSQFRRALQYKQAAVTGTVMLGLTGNLKSSGGEEDTPVRLANCARIQSWLKGLPSVTPVGPIDTDSPMSRRNTDTDARTSIGSGSTEPSLASSTASELVLIDPLVVPQRLRDAQSLEQLQRSLRSPLPRARTQHALVGEGQGGPVVQHRAIANRRRLPAFNLEKSGSAPLDGMVSVRALLTLASSGSLTRSMRANASNSPTSRGSGSPRPNLPRVRHTAFEDPRSPTASSAPQRTLLQVMSAEIY
eukprot:TRINITY_DN7521_c0_g2_i1.p1 TRINITY_DN7521_c0_g2~~TRINITY_DN7521_c0_g2_i1.p1  ORF type:complete len:296 (+),score=57.82 TRINITY_DN7521_c0_g2_i1:488-1375(+)